MKKIISIILATIMVMTLAPSVFAAESTESQTAENQFEDVKSSDWYYEAITYLTDKGIISGTDETHFSPDKNLSRGQALVMISRNYICPINGDKATWDEQINAAYDFMTTNNIISAENYPLDKMNNPITRYEFAQILSGVLKRDGLKVDDGIYSLLNYKEKLNDTYKDDVYNCYIAGVMGGCDSNGTFYGNSLLTRGAAATSIYKLFVPEKRVDITGFQNYTHLLSSFLTNYNNSQTNRAFNVCKAGETISNTIVRSGQEFSFYNVVGNANKANGYKLATIISGGQYIQGYGGGVCQTATTLFNAALLSNMKITERHNHSLKSSYVDAGRDATISSGALDLKFVNQYDTSVKIICRCGNGTISFYIVGSKDIEVPDIDLNVTNNNGVYTLTRTANGTTNYTAVSKYNN